MANTSTAIFLTEEERDKIGEWKDGIPADLITDFDSHAELFTLKCTLRNLADWLSKPGAKGTAIKAVEAFLDLAPQLVNLLPDDCLVRSGYNGDDDADVGVRGLLLNKLMAEKAALPTGIFSDKRCKQHLELPTSEHQDDVLDNPARWQRVQDAVAEVQITASLSHLVDEIDLSSRDLNESTLMHLARLAHTDKYVDKVMHSLTCKANERGVIADSMSDGSISINTSNRDVKRDTKMTQGTKEAVLSSVNAVLEAIDAVDKGNHANAFVCVRPPGHHVGRDGRTHDASTQGFCHLNNVAIGVMYALNKLDYQRLTVIDFDVHHGNGTEEILASDPKRCQFISVHAHGSGFYPQTGGPGDNGRTNVINVPLAWKKGKRVKPADFDNAWKQVEGEVEKFRPQLIFLSAGFDAHKHDPTESGKLTDEDFGRLTHKIVDLSCRIESCHGRVISVLEGGYHVTVRGGLQSSVKAHLEELLQARQPPADDQAGAEEEDQGGVLT